MTARSAIDKQTASMDGQLCLNKRADGSADRAEKVAKVKRDCKTADREFSRLNGGIISEFRSILPFSARFSSANRKALNESLDERIDPAIFPAAARDSCGKGRKTSKIAGDRDDERRGALRLVSVRRADALPPAHPAWPPAEGSGQAANKRRFECVSPSPSLTRRCRCATRRPGQTDRWIRRRVKQIGRWI